MRTYDDENKAPANTTTTNIATKNTATTNTTTTEKGDAEIYSFLDKYGFDLDETTGDVIT